MSLVVLNAIFCFIIGACIGSFSNVLIYRLPKNESINFPASHCQSCNTPLKFYHNIPIFSWIFLKGKCAFCKTKISPQYIIVEFISALLMLSSYLVEKNLISAILIGICFILLLALSIIDARYTAVPDALLFPALFFALIYSLYPNFSLIGLRDAFYFALGFFILRALISYFKKREAMGSADIFIAAIIGAVLHYKLGLVAIYLSALFTLIPYAIIRKKDFELAFVPFLSLGLFITYIFQNEILYLIKRYLFIWVDYE